MAIQSLNVNDYDSVEEFIPVLDNEIAKVADVLAQRLNMHMSDDDIFDDLVDLYLMRFQYEQTLEAAYLEKPDTSAVTIRLTADMTFISSDQIFFLTL